MIRTVREAVTNASTDGVATMHDLLDEEEPRRVLAPLDGHPDQAAIEARRRQNVELVRGGSAIGGRCVFLRVVVCLCTQDFGQKTMLEMLCVPSELLGQCPNFALLATVMMSG